MGTYVRLEEADFRIPPERQDAALAALKAAYTPDYGLAKAGRIFLFEDELAATTLAGFFEAWGFDAVIFDPQNAIVAVEYYEERKAPRTDELWPLLAPFIDDGGTVDYLFQENGGEYWRYAFKGGRCYPLPGRVVYDPIPGDE